MQYDKGLSHVIQQETMLMLENSDMVLSFMNELRIENIWDDPSMSN